MAFRQNETLMEFNRLNNVIDDFYHEIAVELGISDSAYEILRSLLILGDGCTQTDIYKYCSLNKQTANSSVKRLEQDGYITFERGNGRELKILLTDKGQEIVQKKILPIEQAENAVFDEMSDEERNMLIRITEEYLNAFRSKAFKILNKIKGSDT